MLHGWQIPVQRFLQERKKDERAALTEDYSMDDIVELDLSGCSLQGSNNTNCHHRNSELRSELRRRCAGAGLRAALQAGEV